MQNVRYVKYSKLVHAEMGEEALPKLEIAVRRAWKTLQMREEEQGKGVVVIFASWLGYNVEDGKEDHGVEVPEQVFACIAERHNDGWRIHVVKGMWSAPDDEALEHASEHGRTITGRPAIEAIRETEQSKHREFRFVVPVESVDNHLFLEGDDSDIVGWA